MISKNQFFALQCHVLVTYFVCLLNSHTFNSVMYKNLQYFDCHPH